MVFNVIFMFFFYGFFEFLSVVINSLDMNFIFFFFINDMFFIISGGYSCDVNLMSVVYCIK